MNNVPQTMRASVLQKVGEISLEERPVPQCGPDEVLVKVHSVGVCGSDVHYYEHGVIGPFVVEKPLILGHESAGEIVAVGENVDSSRIGQRVSIEPQKPCRVCDYCRGGRYNLCPNMEFYATPPIDGAFCEYVLIENDFAFEIPDNISYHAAALMEPLSVGIAACQKGNVKIGDRVLIAGAGPIGIMAAQAARALGATEVFVTDINQLRRELVIKYGVTRAINPLEEDITTLGVDVFIDASGATPAIVSGIKAVRPGGSAILVGSADEIPVSVADIAMKEVNLTGIFRYTQTWPLARTMLANGTVEVDSLVTHLYGLEQVEEALRAEDAPTSIKRIVMPGVDRFTDPQAAAQGEKRA